MAVQPAESLPVTSFTNHLRYFYKFINQRIYDRSDVGVPVDTDNTVIVDNCEKANVFNTYFASVWQEDNNAIHRCENLNVTGYPY